MKITRNYGNNKITFGQLEQGAVFEYENHICMKTEKSKYAGLTNTVDLETGELGNSQDHIEALPLECNATVSPIYIKGEEEEEVFGCSRLDCMRNDNRICLCNENCTVCPYDTEEDDEDENYDGGYDGYCEKCYQNCGEYSCCHNCKNSPYNQEDDDEEDY